jgi:type IV secretion system protein VirB10
MNDPTAADQDVRGERDAPAVLAARSVQSRVSNILALGLMSALGLGALTWYYATTMQRQAQARKNAQAASAHRAQGDMPLPPLGKIEIPARAAQDFATPGAVPGASARAENLNPSAEGGSGGSSPALLAEAAPLTLPAQSTYAPNPGSAPATAPKTPAQLDFERRLSGAAFASESSAPAARATLITEPAGASAAVDPPAGGFSASGPGPAPAAPAATGATRSLASLLRPEVSAAVRAEILPTMRLLLPKGAFIDCTLETAIDSTLPGMTTCVTATDTFGADGKVVLLERGTKLVGEVRGQVEQGAARIFVLWNEARTPTGVIVPLASPGADELGRAGLPGAVDRHFWERFGAAMLVSIIDGAVQAAVQSSTSGTGPVIYNPSGSQSVMTEVLKGTINIAPTITKPQGDRVQVLVARDLDFRPVYELRARSAAR